MPTLKRSLGEAGAGLDESQGSDTLYEVLKGLVQFQDDVVEQFNQLRTDYNANATIATDTTATALTARVTLE